MNLRFCISESFQVMPMLVPELTLSDKAVRYMYFSPINLARREQPSWIFY
jgi:hypothetical protein